jgi:peptide/nickel transport system substrate-binding protein
MIFAIDSLGDLNILPKHIHEGIAQDDERWDDPDDLLAHTGSGPFKYKKRVEGEFTEFTRNEAWWYKLPHIKTLRIDVVLGKDARVLSIKNGDADSERYELWGGYVAQALGDPDIKVVTGLPAQWDYYLAFNLEEVYSPDVEGVLDVPGTEDVRVRRAIAHAIDRDQIVNYAMLGWGTKTYSVIPKSFFPGYHDPAGVYWEYDVDLANKILDDAGYLDVDADGIRELPGATPVGPTTITQTATTIETKTTVVPELLPGVAYLLVVGVVSVTVTYIKRRKREITA